MRATGTCRIGPDLEFDDTNASVRFNQFSDVSYPVFGPPGRM